MEPQKGTEPTALVPTLPPKKPSLFTEIAVLVMLTIMTVAMINAAWGGKTSNDALKKELEDKIGVLQFLIAGDENDINQMVTNQQAAIEAKKIVPTVQNRLKYLETIQPPLLATADGKPMLFWGLVKTDLQLRGLIQTPTTTNP